MLKIGKYELSVENNKPVIRRLICDNPSWVTEVLLQTIELYKKEGKKRMFWDETIKNMPVEDFEIIEKFIKECQKLGFFNQNINK